MVVYYLSDFESVTQKHIDQMLVWMPQQQQELVRSMKTLQRQREQAVAYAMLSLALYEKDNNIYSPDIVLRHIHIEQLNFDNRDFAFPLWELKEHGKPFLTNHDGIEFNISHCSKAIVTAISTDIIGIDVEGRRRFSESVLQRAFNEKEQYLVKKSDEPELEFARIWTRKEAWFKYTGTGILLDHLKTTEYEAYNAGCIIETLWVNDSFWLSTAEKRRLIVKKHHNH